MALANGTYTITSFSTGGFLGYTGSSSPLSVPIVAFPPLAPAFNVSKYDICRVIINNWHIFSGQSTPQVTKGNIRFIWAIVPSALALTATMSSLILIPLLPLMLGPLRKCNAKDRASTRKLSLARIVGYSSTSWPWSIVSQIRRILLLDGSTETRIHMRFPWWG